MLREAGFEVCEAPFEYSSAPGRWGMPAAGVVSALVLLCASHAGARGRAGLALVVLVAAAALLRVVAPIALGSGVASLPFARRRAVNLVATRGTARPRLWLVAHVDSKSQPMPMAARVAGVGASLVVWMLAAALAVTQLRGAQTAHVWPALGLIGVLAAVPVIGSVIGTASPGALDNATGVACVLLAVSSEMADGPPLPREIGVLITSGEEVGLAGARAWGRDAAWGQRIVAQWSAERAVALNVDSVDDVGALRVMTASPLPRSLGRAIDAERSVGRRTLPPGILVDAIALAASGFASLTVSKATIASLARIHSTRDTADRLRGEGVMEAAALLRRLAANA